MADAFHNNSRIAPHPLFVVGTLYPEKTGGLEIFNYYFLRHLIRENSLDFYYLSTGAVERDQKHHIKLKNWRPVRLFYPFEFFITLWRLRKKINLVSLCFAQQSWTILLSQFVLLKLFRIPYIITIHWGQRQTWKFALPYRLYFEGSRIIIAVSEPIAESYGPLFPGKEIRFIPPLIPFESSALDKAEARRQLGFDPGDKIILYVGSLKGMKNPDRIIRALHSLGKEFLLVNNLRLLMLGAGDLRAELDQLISDLHLEDHVTMAGLIGRDHIQDYYRSADAYIISSDYEGTSVSLLEAMFNALPIISSNAPGLNRMLQDRRNALLYNTQSAEDLAEKIRYMLSHPDEMARLGNQARADYEKYYSHQRMMAAYDECLSAAIKPGRHHDPPSKTNKLTSQAATAILEKDH